MTQSSLVKNIGGSIGREHGVLAQTVRPDIVVASQRQRILEALAECCTEKTFAATTIGDIVSTAGVSRRTFYKLFANKKECLEAAVNVFADELAEIVAAAEADDRPWPEKVRGGIAEVLDLLVAKPGFANLALVEVIAVDPVLMGRYWDPLLAALSSHAPLDREGLPSTDAARAAIGTAQVLIARQLTTGRGDRLAELLPDLVYIAMTPYLDQEGALEQARLAR
jgi:AcrR family transcriptional regulator